MTNYDTPRPRPEAKSRLLAVRLPASLIAAIDVQVEAMRMESPWVSLTRSDAVRWLLQIALEQEQTKLSVERPRIHEARD
jgi:hypothetical protein